MISTIEIFKGDITKLKVDAIVNAANSSLLGGCGVDGAIHRAAGPKLLEECKKLNGCKAGEAKITKGYNLQSKFVIHTVGPVWNGGNYSEDELLTNCYLNSLKLAVENKIKTIAFPAISTGVYGFPLERAAQIAIKTVKKFIQTEKLIQKIIFVCFDDRAYHTYKINITID
jgi:O-acetyl-ADP-ribose deacetylase (regulator of RNase III)